MTAHIVHPRIREYGLADGCPRCAEHAEAPWNTLDDRNLADLAERAVWRSPVRSHTEGLALDRVRELCRAYHRVDLVLRAYIRS